MSSKTTAQKMHIKPGQRVVLLNAPAGYIEELGELPDGAMLATSLGEPADVIQCFVTSMQQLQDVLPALLAALKPTGFLWMTYPKLTSRLAGDLSRDVMWAYVSPLGLKPVAMFAVDEDWSAFGMRRK